MHACMDHHASARSLLAIAAKLPNLSAADHAQKAQCSIGGWSNPRSVQTNMSWHGLWITNLHCTLPRAFEKKIALLRPKILYIQEVSKTCSGVKFGQHAHDHRGSKSGQWLGDILLNLVVTPYSCTKYEYSIHQLILVNLVILPALNFSKTTKFGTQI